jgi:hypothetical protein
MTEAPSEIQTGLFYGKTRCNLIYSSHNLGGKNIPIAPGIKKC